MTAPDLVPLRGDVIRVVPPLVLNGLAPVLAQAQAWLEHQKLVAKLTWSLREAREMTGLSEPALRAMIERTPALAIRHGRRWRIKAEGLRRELG